jgi:hypothetical protein
MTYQISHTYRRSDGSWDRARIMREAHALARSLHDAIDYHERLSIALRQVWEDARQQAERSRHVSARVGGKDHQIPDHTEPSAEEKRWAANQRVIDDMMVVIRHEPHLCVKWQRCEDWLQDWMDKTDKWIEEDRAHNARMRVHNARLRRRHRREQPPI